MNWGWKLAIGSAMFMAMIIYFVVQSFNNKTELVSENYYEEELRFQEIIDAKQNASDLNDTLFVKQVGDQVVIDYPEFFANNICEGTIHFYKPANEKDDKKTKFSQNGGQQLIPRSQLAVGRYVVKVDLKVKNKTYYYEKDLTLQ